VCLCQAGYGCVKNGQHQNGCGLGRAFYSYPQVFHSLPPIVWGKLAVLAVFECLRKLFWS
ncbi:hypothetical protein, partial [Laribacter hongkongensis]|uniref:hypothetical protein n=1 Tax=Laribacter hongkongensis TaxID=168471 RepID=UPI001EFCAB77